MINNTLEIQATNTINEIPGIILQWYKQGLPDREIRKRVELAKPKYKEFDVDRIIDIALDDFKKEFCRERDHVLALHLSRYNETINILCNFQSKFRGQRAVYDTNDTYQQLLVVMKQKETLFGFHKKSFQIKVSSVINKRKQAILGDKFNISLLNSEEQLDFLRLLTKAKSNPEDDIKSISTKQQKPQYADFEEIEQKQLPQVELVKLINENQESNTLSIESVTEKLRETQLKLIAEAYGR